MPSANRHALRLVLMTLTALRARSLVQPFPALVWIVAAVAPCGGVDVATVADRLGHADGGVTTLRSYASGTRTADQRAAEQLSQSFQLHRNGGEITTEDTAAPVRNADRRRKRRVMMKTSNVLSELA